MKVGIRSRYLGDGCVDFPGLDDVGGPRRGHLVGPLRDQRLGDETTTPPPSSAHGIRQWRGERRKVNGHGSNGTALSTPGLGHSCAAADDQTIERERRQLELMNDRLDRFASGELSIGPVINDLEALLNELELVDDDWRDRFVEAWSELEIPYAVALDRLEPIPTTADEGVRSAIASLRTLVLQALANTIAERRYDLDAAIAVAASGSVPEQMDAVATLVEHLDDREVEGLLLNLLRHPENLGPICEAARSVLAVGTDRALRLFAIAWHQTEDAEEWQAADCLGDAASAAAGSGAVSVLRWQDLGQRADDPEAAAGAASIWRWITEGMGIAP